MAGQPCRFPIPAASWQKPHTAEITIRKSRFLAQGCHCASRAAALEFVAAIRAAWPDATHNCWAYVAGPPACAAAIGQSDDGEPRGTAGRPMLNVLLHSGIGQICVVVSRWFGGIKLGAGGLVRAYQDAALACLAAMPTREAVKREKWLARVDYQHLDALKRGLGELEACSEAEEYGQQARLTLSLPEDRAAALRELAAAISGGRAEVTRLDADNC